MRIFSKPAAEGRLGALVALTLALAGCAASPTSGAAEASPPRVGAGPAAPAAYADRAEELVEQAEHLYRNAQFAIAIARAQQAQDVLTARASSSSDRALGARAAFISGCSLAAFGANEQAVAAFSRARSLDPQFAPPQGWLSPRLEKLYLAAQTP